EGDAESEWDALVDAEEKKLGDARPLKGAQLPNRAKAVLAAAKKRPDLHRAFVAAANDGFARGVPQVFSR
ncbi:MAG TPA: hypothetical protein VFX03_05985, partial [Thermomicrobiales bacterium]|nr:hypothetical protein [Thermomicrobiales bacterium]